MPNAELTVRQVMELHPVVVPPTAPIQTVVTLMHDCRIGSVLVVEDSRLVGIFTERDLLRRVSTAVPGWRDYPVSQWMTAAPHTIPPDVGWDDAVGRMHQLRVRHLPVVEGDAVVGVISTRLLMGKRDEYLTRRIEEGTRQLRHANDQLIARDGEVLHSLRTAGRLQTKIMLPPAPPKRPGMKWALHYEPLDHLGGDYCDFAEEPGRLGFLIADASGHSIAAAMVAMMARFAFTQAQPKSDPAAVLGAMNERLLEVSEERFVTAFYSVFDEATGVLHYSAAGHPYPLHFEKATGEVKPLVAQGFLLGIMSGEVYTARCRQLAPGDKVCFTTDGVSEARNEIGEMYGTERLTECLRVNGNQSAEAVLWLLMESLHDFRGNTPFNDDVTMAVLAVGECPP